MQGTQTKCNPTMETKLKRIMELSNENHKMKFKWLIQHFNKENLISCFHALDGKKAVGIDGITKDEYGKNLEKNIDCLIQRMKNLKYYPAPVRGVKIPKGNGKYRPLGISNIEDKIVQMMFSKILEAIYEPLFMGQSYGFRPKRSCHDAIKDVYTYLNRKNYGSVIDLDLRNYFGTIDHRKLIQLLEMKIDDRTFIRYIVRMLKAGVLTNGELKKGDEGTPQGSIVSPILANIFAHYAIDIFLKDLAFKTRSEIYFVRYCDDIIVYSNKKNAEKVLSELRKRLERFSLELNEDKTVIVNFSKEYFRKGNKQGTFNFLGFTFYLGLSRKNRVTVKIKTISKTLTRKLKEITIWCKLNRSRYRLKFLWNIFKSKIRGHIEYYGISHNFRSVSNFIFNARRIFFKWINKRSQKKSFDWKKFESFENLFPLPKAKIVHKFF